MIDRYANLGETAEWNDAENRKQEAIQRLFKFARTTANPDHTIVCAKRVHELRLRPHWMWPLGTRP